MVTLTRLTVVKLLELILVVVILVLHFNHHASPTNTVTKNLIVVGTFGGFFIILVGLFAGGIMGTPVNRRVDLFYSLVGCALFIAAGAMILDAGTGGIGTTLGVLSIIEGVLFLVDAVLTFRGEA